MKEHYSAARTDRRLRVVRRIEAFALLLAAGYYVLTTGLPPSTGIASWALGLALWLLKCFLVVRSVIRIAATVHVWVNSLRLLGPSAIKAAPTMLRLGRLSAVGQGWRTSRLFALFTLVLIVAWLILDIELALFVGIYTASVVFLDLVGSARIVGVLFLSRSSRANLVFQAELKEAALGLRVVSCLDQKLTPGWRITRVLGANIYRTSDSAEWVGLVQELMDLTQIIILDARQCSPALIVETGLAATPGRRRKVLVLTEDDGTAPVLEEFARDSDDALVRDLPRLTGIQLLAEVHRRIASRFYPRHTQGRQLSIREQDPRRHRTTPAPRVPSRVFVPALRRTYEVPVAAQDPYTPAEMAAALGNLGSVALHCDYPDGVEELDVASRGIQELLQFSGAHWVAAAEEADATIWIQRGTGEMRYDFAVASPHDADRFIAAQSGPREFTACVATAVCELLQTQKASVSKGDLAVLTTTINGLCRALTKALQIQDVERARLLMLELKVAIERIGCSGSTEAIPPIVDAIADAAAACDGLGFAEAHALLASAIEAAHNVGPVIIPMLKRGADHSDPAVRRAFQIALRRFGKKL